MKAAEWIDRVKTARKWESDYRVAKELGISVAVVSTYRTKTSTFNEDVAIKVATALGVDPAGIVLDQLAERTKSPAVAAALHDAASRLCILC